MKNMRVLIQIPAMSYMSKFVGALIGLLLMAIVASRQLFLFAVLRDTSGLSIEGGRSHFWLAVVAGVTSCVAGCLMFHFFNRHEKDKWSRAPMTLNGPLLSPLVQNPSAISPALIPFDPIRWALANPWLTGGQADDRMPMNGSVADSGETPSGQRAFARLAHQVMFKKWSQARHD